MRVGGTIDSVASGGVLYSGVNKKLQRNTSQPPVQSNNQNYNNIGTSTNFEKGSLGNIRQEIYRDDNFSLQERYDFGGHNNPDKPVPPHVNYDLKGMDGQLSRAVLGRAHTKALPFFDNEDLLK